MAVHGRQTGYRTNPQERVRGAVFNPGPHIATVIDNVDMQHRGRITVHIPALNNESHETITVSYASPFASTTQQEGSSNLYNGTHNPSGMWVPTPDIGSQVLVTFPTGDPTSGIWFACLPSNFNMHAIPGHASTEFWDRNSGAEADAAGTTGNVQPVGEYRETIDSRTGNLTVPARPLTEAKPVNTYLAAIYKMQGLDRDSTRGHTTSSSLRDTPSTVFGVSTKGRPRSELTPAEISLLERGNVTAENRAAISGKLNPKTRLQGHTFVMDDGDLRGDNNLVRLRTASGHQILMHDTAGLVYLANAKGTAWMELNDNGTIDMYAEKGVSLRTTEINLQSTGDFNIDAAGDFKLSVGGSTKIESKRSMDIKTTAAFALDATQNISIKGASTAVSTSGEISIVAGGVTSVDGSLVLLGEPGTSARSVSSLPRTDQTDTVEDGTGHWRATSSISTIVTRMPAHEPWDGHTTELVPSGAGTTFNEISPTPPVEQTNPPPTVQPVLVPVEERLRDSSLLVQPEPPGAVCGLTLENTRRLLAIIAQSESSDTTVDLSVRPQYIGFAEDGQRISAYQNINRFFFLGRYQFGAQALETVGFLREGTYAGRGDAGNRIMQQPHVWLGELGVSSASDYLNNPSAQDEAMIRLLNFNCTILRRFGIITGQSTQSERAGFLMGAHLKGPGGVRDWVRSGIPNYDGNGTSVATYYSRGASAVENIPTIPSV